MGKDIEVCPSTFLNQADFSNWLHEIELNYKFLKVGEIP